MTLNVMIYSVMTKKIINFFVSMNFIKSFINMDRGIVANFAFIFFDLFINSVSKFIVLFYFRSLLLSIYENRL